MKEINEKITRILLALSTVSVSVETSSCLETGRVSSATIEKGCIALKIHYAIRETEIWLADFDVKDEKGKTLEFSVQTRKVQIGLPKDWENIEKELKKTVLGAATKYTVILGKDADNTEIPNLLEIAKKWIETLLVEWGLEAYS